MPSPWPHLSELAQTVVDLDDQSRINFIREPHWLPYPKSQQFLALFEDLLARPQVPRSPCYVLLGATNNGKSALLTRFLDQHPFEEDGLGRGAHLPVFYVSAPPVADEKRFYDAMLEAVEVKHHTSNIAQAQSYVIQVLRTLGTRILLIDEIQHLVAAGALRSRQMMNVLKYMSNDLEISIIGAGIQTAFHALQSDPQMANRFKPLVLTKWELNQEFLQLLVSFERLLPLRKPSGLTNKDMATKLFRMVDGKIGELATVLADAAVVAIRNGEERITLQGLNHLGWVAPNERKRVVEGML